MLAIAILTSGCRKSTFLHPDAIHTKVENLLVHGDLDTALETAEQASVEFAPKDAVWSWKFRLLMARVLLRQGKNESALQVLSKDLPSPLINTDIAFERAILQAWAYTWLGDRTHADGKLSRAKEISALSPSIQKDDPTQLENESYNAWGLIYLQRADQSDLTLADQIFRHNLAIADKRNDLYQRALAQVNLSAVALRKERFDEALDWSVAASRAAKSIDSRSLVEKSQGNIAWANYKLGNFEESLSGFRVAERGAEALGQAYDRMEWLNDIGLSLYRLGHVQEAESYYKNALNIAEEAHDAENMIGANVALSELLLQSNDIVQSNLHADKALAVTRSAQRKFDEMNVMFLKSLIAARTNQFDRCLEILKSLQEKDSLTPSLRWQVEGELANQYAHLTKTSLADKWYRQSIATFESQRKTLQKEDSRLPFSTNADQLYSNYIHFLVHQKRTDDALQWLDLERARTLEEGLGIAAPDFSTTIQHRENAQATAQRLHSTILVYHLAADESYMWAITPIGTRFFILPGEAEIDGHVKNYQRAILASRDTLADSYTDGMALYKTLIEPVERLIPKNSSVYIIPDGSLATLNFETLLAPGGGLHYWIEDATITNASSLKLLSSFHPEAKLNHAKKLLLIGNPISPDEKYPDLPHAGDEVREVSDHFSSTDKSVFTGQQAQPAAYRNSTPGQYSYIHFVAHGTSSSASPLDSAIILTRDPTNPDAYKLYARDVIRQPLHAGLVTISACYGSGSRQYGGEGLVGLSWAFLRAGSHYVVGSLWEVSDAAAPQVMDDLYEELVDGRNPAAALRQAKLGLVHSKGVYRKPFYWATFQIYGGA